MNDILYVWIYPEGEIKPVICGVLELLNGRRCLFSYASSWLARSNAHPLAPDMPLHAGALQPPAGFDIHPIFEDAGPDRWGKNIINKVFNPERRSPLEYLELAGENRIGALGFSRSDSEYKALAGASFHAIDLPDLIRASNALVLQIPIDDNLRRLLRPGSSAGGARPKSIIKHHEQDWIAKFPAAGDEYDVCAIEHASLVLAKMCGINTAESELIKVGKQNVLLVKRFDRKDNKRDHFASARTMLISDGVAEDAMAYADLADIARRLSSTPKDDCHELFRRMVFNVLLENTDDHERNHAFLYQDKQWILSPAYDVLPQHQGLGFHQMRIGRDGNEAKIANVLSACERFLLLPYEAEMIVVDIHEKVSRWRDVFMQAGVSEHDIKISEGYILRDQIFQFGKVPERFEAPSNKDYSGQVIAIDMQHAYQAIGRNEFIQHNREDLKIHLSENQLILPANKLNCSYRNNKIAQASIAFHF